MLQNPNRRMKECNSLERYINLADYRASMKQDMISISRKEYEGMKETIEMLQSPEMMRQILESEKNISEGKIKKFDV